MAAAHSTQVEIGGRRLTLETGRVAKQADGAVLVRYGDTVVLATVTPRKSAIEGQDFFPSRRLSERGLRRRRIPGGFFKREGRPVEKEILTSRLIDRPLRPLFPKGFRNEIQLIALAISADQENDPDILGDERGVGGGVRGRASRSWARSAPCASASSTAGSS